MKGWCGFAAMAVIGVLLLVAPEFKSWAYDPFGDYTEVPLSKLQSNPSAYKNASVEFHCFLNKIEKLWAHFYTPFTPDDYTAFSAWDADRLLWVKEDYMSDFPFIFIRKDNEYLSTILQAPRFAVFKLSCIVRNDFNNIPWLEVVQAHVAECGHHTDKSLRAMIAATTQFQAKDYRAAIAEYKNALAVNLSNRDEGLTLKQLATAQYLVGDYEDAWRSARRGLVCLKHDPELKKLKEAADAAASQKRTEQFKERLEERRRKDQRKRQPVQVEPPEEPKKPEVELKPVPSLKDETWPDEEGDQDTGRGIRQDGLVSIMTVIANRRVAQLESDLNCAIAENEALKLASEDLGVEIEGLRVELGDAAARSITLCAELARMKLVMSEKDTAIATLGRKLASAYLEIHKTLRKDEYAVSSRRQETGPLGPGQATAGRVDRRSSPLRRFNDEEIRREVESHLRLAGQLPASGRDGQRKIELVHGSEPRPEGSSFCAS